MEGTLKSVADIGYREVELAGLAGATAHAMQASLKRYKLDAPSIHASYDRLRLDFESVLEEARTLGAGFLVCPSVDAGERERPAGREELDDGGALHGCSPIHGTGAHPCKGLPPGAEPWQDGA